MGKSSKPKKKKRKKRNRKKASEQSKPVVATAKVADEQEESTSTSLAGQSTDEVLTPPSPGFWKNAWQRYRKDKVSMFGLYVLLMMFAIALFSPMIVGTKPIICKYQGKYYFPFMGYFNDSWENSIFITRDKFNGIYPGNLQKQPELLLEKARSKQKRTTKSIARIEKKIGKHEKKYPQAKQEAQTLLKQLPVERALRKNTHFQALLAKKYQNNFQEILEQKRLSKIDQLLNPTPQEQRGFKRLIDRKKISSVKMLWLMQELARKHKILEIRKQEVQEREQEQQTATENWAIYPLIYADPYNKLNVELIQRLVKAQHIPADHWAASIDNVEANSSPPWPVPLFVYKWLVGYQEPKTEIDYQPHIAVIKKIIAAADTTQTQELDKLQKLVGHLSMQTMIFDEERQVSAAKRVKNFQQRIEYLQFKAKIPEGLYQQLPATIAVLQQKLTQQKVALQKQKLQTLFGTDMYARDVFARIIHGTRIALLIGFVSMGIATLIGVFLGGIAGFFRGWIDTIISRFIELIMSIPPLILILSMIAIVEKPTIWHIMVVIGLTSWVSIARLTRGEFIKLSTLDYVVAGQALGFSNFRIMFRHILPNALAPIIVNVTFRIAAAILTESGLSFLGFGVQEPTPSWGSILNTGFKGGLSDYWLIGSASIAIFIAIFTYNIVGDGLQEALDPRLK